MQEVAGKIVDSESQAAKGNAKKHLGKLRPKIGGVKHVLKNAQKGT